VSPRLLDRGPTGREIASAFLVCLVPVQLWSLISFLREVPAWLLQMSLWDIVGAISYGQAFALLETAVIFTPLIVLAVALPSAWFRQKFVAMSTGIVYLSAGWFVVAHLNDARVQALGLTRRLLPYLGLYAASSILVSVAINRSGRIRSAIESAVERLTVLGKMYLLVALAAVGVVLIRNL